VHRLLLSIPAALTLSAGLDLLLASPLGAQERHVLTGASAVIWNLAGDVRLEAGGGSDVVVEVTRGGGDGKRLDVSASAGQLRVRYPADEIVYRDGDDRSSTTLSVRDDGTFDGGWEGRGRRTRIRTYGDGLEAHADLRVLVPAGKRLEVNLALGSVTVTNVDGDLRLDVHAARVRASGTKGRLAIDAGSGSVVVENGAGELDIDTGSGSSDITGFRGRSVTIDAGSGSVIARDVTVERWSVEVGSGRVRDDLRVDTGSGGVELALTKVPGATDIDTGSGSVRLELPANANATVDINTGSGGISSDFPVTMEQVRRRELLGNLGEVGPMIRVSTGSGGVRLLQR
jgi:hypothetical protein